MQIALFKIGTAKNGGKIRLSGLFKSGEHLPMSGSHLVPEPSTGPQVDDGLLLPEPVQINRFAAGQRRINRFEEARFGRQPQHLPVHLEVVRRAQLLLLLEQAALLGPVGPLRGRLARVPLEQFFHRVLPALLLTVVVVILLLLAWTVLAIFFFQQEEEEEQEEKH